MKWTLNRNLGYQAIIASIDLLDTQTNLEQVSSNQPKLFDHIFKDVFPIFSRWLQSPVNRGWPYVEWYHGILRRWSKSISLPPLPRGNV